MEMETDTNTDMDTDKVTVTETDKDKDMDTDEAMEMDRLTKLEIIARYFMWPNSPYSAIWIAYDISRRNF